MVPKLCTGDDYQESWQFLPPYNLEIAVVVPQIDVDAKILWNSVVEDSFSKNIVHYIFLPPNQVLPT